MNATSESESDFAEDSTTDTSDQIDEATELAAKVDLLTAENEQLREQVAKAQRSRYRETAIGLCGTGVLFGLLAVVLQSMSTVLFALSGIGIFSGILTYFLTPEHFITADIGQEVYAATAESLQEICADLGLSDRYIYLTTGHTAGEVGESSWLFIPETEETTPPSPAKLETGFVIEDGNRGLSVRPTGSGLFTAFEQSLAGALGTAPEVLCEQLSDAIIEDFELADNVDFEVDTEDGRVSVQLTNVLYAKGGHFDHPVASFFAVGLATGLKTRVTASVTEMDPLSVTFRWEPTPEE